jgi:zinc protease
VYSSDSQSRLARHYGWRLATGMSIDDVESWPARLKQVTLEDIRKVARKYLVDKNSVTGVLIPSPAITTKHDEKPAHAANPGRS